MNKIDEVSKKLQISIMQINADITRNVFSDILDEAYRSADLKALTYPGKNLSLWKNTAKSVKRVEKEVNPFMLSHS